MGNSTATKPKKPDISDRIERDLRTIEKAERETLQGIVERLWSEQ